MIRYVISYPVEARMYSEEMQHLQQMLKDCANDREWRDLIINRGGTITDMRCKRPVAALVRRARARAR